MNRKERLVRFWMVAIWMFCVGCSSGNDSEAVEDVADEAQDILYLGEDAVTDVVGTQPEPNPDTENVDIHEPGPVDSGAEDVADEEPVIPSNLVINEVVVKAENSAPDWIEIRNLEGITVELGGWGIRDHLNAHEYLFPPGTTIPAFGYKVVWGKGAGFEFTMDFTFGVDKEARLFAPDGTLVDTTDWGEGDAPEGTSWGRYPDGIGPFMTLDVITQGQANSPPSSGL